MTEPTNQVAADAAQALAETAAAAMWTRDHAAQALDIAIVRVAPGYAQLTLAVRRDMVYGHHICHGGMIFSLADTAFAYSCNSYNKNTVGSSCNIDFLAPAKEGDTLQAEALERSQAGRTGVYDVTVRTQTGKVVALFRGKSYRAQGEVIAGLQQAAPSK